MLNIFTTPIVKYLMNSSKTQVNIMSFKKCKSKHDRSVREFDKNGNRAIQGAMTVVDVRTMN